MLQDDSVQDGAEGVRVSRGAGRVQLRLHGSTESIVSNDRLTPAGASRSRSKDPKGILICFVWN